MYATMQGPQFPPPPAPPPVPSHVPAPVPGLPGPFSPYAPPGAYAPQAPLAGTLPGAHVALYTSGQIAVATFLGSFLGGSILFSLNERRLGRPLVASVSLGVGIMCTLILVAISLALPEGAYIPGPVYLLPIIAMRLVAQKRQGELVAYHINAGGKRGSNWVIAGIGLASLVAIFVPVVLFGVVKAIVE